MTLEETQDKEDILILMMINERDKQIDLMSKKINESYFDKNRFGLWFENKIIKMQNAVFNYGCLSDRINKIKQYFEKLAKEKE